MTLFEEFLLRYPEFKNPPVTVPPTPPVTDDMINYWLDWAENWLCPNAWGKSFREAVMAFTAIMLRAWQMQQMGLYPAGTAVTGPVASASVGGESVSYGGRRGSAYMSLTDEWLDMFPPYGPYFRMLRDASISGVMPTFTWYNWWEVGNSC